MNALKLLKRTGIDFHKWSAFVTGIPSLWTRPFDLLPLKGVGAEIGVYRGFHARDLLTRHPAITKLWLVDPYRRYGSYDECTELHNAMHDALRINRKFDHRIQWLRAASPDCIKLLPPLDFAYIDAAHSYEPVRDDIAAVWPRIVPGGIMGGHDFAHWHPGVIRAVCEFAVENSLQLNATTPDWWVIKP